MEKTNRADIVISQDTLYCLLLLVSTVGGSYLGFNRYLRQYQSARQIPASIFKKRWLYGKVTSVGDGDNFHFYHLPGGRIGGWGWLRSVPRLDKAEFTSNKNIKTTGQSGWFKKLRFNRNNNIVTRSNYYMSLQPAMKGKIKLPTIPVRLCGVDAPERAHFGNPSQPFSDEALNWLRYTILAKRVWIKPLSIDQYNRCVARAVYWSWLGGWKDISLQMVKEGLAVVYEGKSGAEFDGQERKYRFNEFLAKSQKKGLWIQKKLLTPGEYKKRNKNS
ncbi:Lcl3p KNAG_0F02110 [Huiozyma naganishii CBS 8797]|uniref:Probable endonuclease LCL3 n=1 Tax=Huiozyma naganishii (strain ATCC MYA-139 / BCRC 22969 / CBS 8797 / KCTC 17520 / NBRC 10181 / NCYC 3082 / Yp74L-3) TaxID=1071383 RepID=J7RMT3_HUIN7|nr:hypothetical protein KNAG_0F02110 [Kazachstania naganishii CBS 8797]CCK70878.1 hypothetical protein KNAG_0F02110 [Kazachstania naganishii CBS 8797]